MADPQNGNQSLALQGRFGGFPQGGSKGPIPAVPLLAGRPISGSRDSLPRSPPRMAESVEVTNCDWVFSFTHVAPWPALQLQ